MRVLGIDPGTQVAGYAVLDTIDTKIHVVALGTWVLQKKAVPLAERLGQLTLEFQRALKAFHPELVCIELPFVAKNAQSALVLGTARGVILAQTYLAGIPFKEINATKAKKQVTGNGYADKQTVANVLSSMTGLDLKHLPLDATDALAIAYSQCLEILSNQRYLKHDSVLQTEMQKLLKPKKQSTKKRKEAWEKFLQTRNEDNLL